MQKYVFGSVLRRQIPNSQSNKEAQILKIRNGVRTKSR